MDIDTDFDLYLENDCRHIFKLANIFETDKIRMFSFFNAYGKDQRVFKYLKKMVTLAKEYGLTLYHENEKEIYGDTKSRVLKLKENVPGLKFIYDPANFIQVGERKEDTLPLLEICDYVHVKDALFEGGEIVPAGYGDADFSEIIKRVRERDITLTLEPHLALFAGYASIDASELRGKFNYKTNDEAFDAAVAALKSIM